MTPPTEDAAATRLVAHIRTHFGEPVKTLHFTKQEPHMRLFVIERPRGMAGTLVITCGMSAQPMPVDHVENESLRYAELCMLLPPSWPTEPSRLDDLTEWPFNILVECARYPHQEQTRLWEGHTVYDGEPWPGTLLSSVMLTPPPLFESETWEIEGDPPIWIFQLVPITADELAYKEVHRSVGLMDWLLDYDPHIFGPLEPTRRCAVSGKHLFAEAPQPLGPVEGRDPTIDLVAERLTHHAAALIDRFGFWRRALDTYEMCRDEHELMQDEDTEEALDDAIADADRAHKDMRALLRSLDASTPEIVFAALERVLDRGGVSSAYMKQFRAWPPDFGH